MHITTRIALCLAGTVALASGCSRPEPTDRAGAAAPARVIVEPLSFERMNTRLEAVGTSRALRSADLYPVDTGEVVAVSFEPGQFVEKGTTLVELDSREQKLAVELAEVRLEDARRLYDRYQRSASSGAVLPTVLDQAKTAVLTAEIELEQARVALADRSMLAPFAGFVGATEVDPGDRINTGTLVTTLDDRRTILVSFEVPEAFVGQLGIDDSVDLQLWNARAPGANGRIVDIGSRIDPQTRTFVARARVDNDDDELRPGMSFRVMADIEGEVYPVVTETGLQWGADGAYIWRVLDNKATRLPVEVVQRRQGRVLIDADLDADAIIVVEGIQRMRNGLPVSYESRVFAEDTTGKVRDDRPARAGSD